MDNNNVKFLLSVDGTQTVLSQFDRVRSAMSGISDASTNVSTALKGLGVVFSSGAVLAWAKSTIDAGDVMNDLSQRTGIAVKDLAKYELAAAQSGTTMEALSKGIKGVSVNLLEHGDALKKAGLSATNADEAMMQLADLFQAMPDGMEKTALAVKMFGKSGMDLIPMLNLGSEGLKEAADKSAKYAMTMAALAPQADKFNDNLAELSMLSKIAGMSLMNDVLPSLLKISQTMIDAKQNGQGFWATMNAGIWAFENEASKHLPGIFESYATAMPRQISNLKEELAELQSEKGSLKLDLFGAGPKIDEAIKQTVKELASAEEAYKKYLITVNGPAGGDKGGSAIKPNTLIKDWKAQLKALLKAWKDASGLKDVESEYDKLIKKIGTDVAKAAAEAESAQNGYNKAQTDFIELTKTNVWSELTADEKMTVATLYEARIKSEQLTDATKLMAKADLESATARDKLNTSLIDGLDKMQKDSLAQQEANDRLGLSKEAIAQLDAQKLESQAVTLELMAIKTLDNQLDLVQYNLYKAQAEELRNLAKLKGQGAAKEASIDAAKTAAEEWKKASDSINSTLTDALMRGFESGKSFAVNMRDTIVNMFQTMVLRPIVSAIISPVSMGLAGALGAGSANAATGASGAGWSSMLGAAGINTGYFTNIGAASVGGISSWGANLYSKGFETIGSSMMDLGKGLVKYSEDITSAGNYLGYASALYAASQGKWGTAIGAGIGTYFGGPIGAWIGSKIGGWIDSYFGGETRSGGTYKYNPADGTSFAGGPSGGQIAGDTVTQAINSTVSAINGMLYAVGSQSHIAGFIAGLETSDNNRGGVMAGGTLSGGGSFGQNGSGSVYSGTYYDKSKSFNMTAKEAATAFGLELDQAKIEALQAAVDVPKAIKTMLSEANGAYIDASKLTQDETTALLSNIDTMITNVLSLKDTLGLLPFLNLKNLSFDAAAGLISAAGGLDKLGTSLATYYDKFYNDVEKRAQSVINVGTALANSGATIPTILQDLSASAVDTQVEVDAVRLAYRNLVEAQNVTTASGASTYAALISVAGAFDALTPAIAATTAAASTVMTVEKASSALSSAAANVTASLRSIGDAVAAFASAAASTAADVVTARDAISTALFAAQDAQVAAQSKVNDLIAQAADNLKKFSTTIDDFLASIDPARSSTASLASLKAQLSATAVLASGGDTAAQGQLISQAQAVLKAAEASSTDRVQYARSEAFVRSTLAAVKTAVNPAPIVDAVAVAIVDPLQIARNELQTATNAVQDYVALAQQTGAATSRSMRLAADSVVSLASAYNSAFVASIDAQNNYRAAINATSGLALTTSGSFDSLISSLEQYTAANEVLRTATAAMATAMGNPTASADQLGTALGLTGNALKDFVTVVQGLALTLKGLIVPGKTPTAFDAAGGTMGAAKSYSTTELVSALGEAVATGASPGAIVNAANVNWGIDAETVKQISHIAGNSAMEAAAVAATTTIHGTGGQIAGAQDWTMARAQAALTEGLSQGYDAATMIWAAAQNYGISEADVRAAGQAASLPGFAGGTGFVPYDMTANIHAGEEITPRPYVDMQRASRDETNDLLRRLVASNTELKAEVTALKKSNEATQKAAEKTSETLTIVTRGGRAIQTEAFT